MSSCTKIVSEFGLHLQHIDKDGRVLRDQLVSPGAFDHAVRHTRFDALRLGLVEEYQLLGGEAKIVPLFPDGDSSSPRTRGFRVTADLVGGGQHSCDFGISYFGSTAREVRAELLRTKEMSIDAELYYRLNAFLADEEPARPANKLAISLDPIIERMTLPPGHLRDYGPTEAWDGPIAGHLPVLFERTVLQEIVGEARADPVNEIAGFLLGNLKHDRQHHMAFLVVSGLASAGGTTESSSASVTYTPASFIQARSIAQLRDSGEAICGWYHSHPFTLCADCPTPAHASCIDKILLYSLDDFHLMETTFEQPFMVGLLTAVEPRIEEALGRLPVKLYGWRSGEIQARGFEVIGTSVDAANPGFR